MYCNNAQVPGQQRAGVALSTRERYGKGGPQCRLVARHSLDSASSSAASRRCPRRRVSSSRPCGPSPAAPVDVRNFLRARKQETECWDESDGVRHCYCSARRPRPPREPASQSGIAGRSLAFRASPLSLVSSRAVMASLRCDACARLGSVVRRESLGAFGRRRPWQAHVMASSFAKLHADRLAISFESSQPGFVPLVPRGLLACQGIGHSRVFEGRSYGSYARTASESAKTVVFRKRAKNLCIQKTAQKRKGPSN